jgi:hypothetical protein
MIVRMINWRRYVKKRSQYILKSCPTSTLRKSTKGVNEDGTISRSKFEPRPFWIRSSWADNSNTVMYFLAFTSEFGKCTQLCDYVRDTTRKSVNIGASRSSGTPLVCYLHGAEPFLRCRQLCSYSTFLPNFTETEGSLPHSQEPTTGPYPERDLPSAYNLSTIHFNIIHPTTSWSS